jgi:surface antigen
MRRLIVVACLTLTGTIVVGLDSPAAQDKPKFTISEVMQQAHKGGLLKKVQNSQADADEGKQLVEYYTALTQNKPPMGDEKAWKKQTETMLAGAKLYADGKKDEGAAALKKTVNCANCHKMFKG